MPKIATTLELQRKLKRLIRYASTPRPSRSKLAAALATLAESVRPISDPHKTVRHASSFQHDLEQGIRDALSGNTISAEESLRRLGGD